MRALAALCDVNVLLALVTDRHAQHAGAMRWFNGVAAGDAVVCRTVQMSLLRLLNNLAVMREEVLDAAFEKYTNGRLFSPRLWTDAYLAAYALVGGLTLMMFDRGFRAFPGLQSQIIDMD